MGSIYKITNTVNGKAYIGKTIHDAVKTRIRDHLRGKGSQPVKDAIEKYGQDAFTFEILHDGIIPEFLDDLEKEVIAKFNTVSPHGYNLDTGGGGGKTPSEETRRKQSEAHTGRTPWNKGKTCKPLSEEHRHKISKSLKGRTGKPHSEESKRKMSEAKKGKPAWNRGIPLSEETRKKISLAQRGKSHSKETREKMSRSHRGKSPSKAHREKLSLANRGKTLSKEHREKLSLANRGKPLSKEHREKISLANKGKPAHNKGKPLTEEHRRKLLRPEWEEAHEFYLSLPSDMDLKEKRRLLQKKINGVTKDTLNRWTREWHSELE